MVNAVGVCSHDVKTLELLEELYVFMCGHKRNDVFTMHILTVLGFVPLVLGFVPVVWVISPR